MTTLTGNLPPQAIDLEEAILGAILTDKDCLIIALTEINSPEIFYVNAHKEIFKTIKELFSASKPVDILTVSNSLKISGKIKSIGGVSKIAELSSKNGS